MKKRSAKYTLAPDANIEYKDLALLQKYLTDRAKIVSRRISGITGKQQRNLSVSVKRARYLGLLPSGSVKK
ncbi:MAG: 30S ribosomal protein S18 [Candidatus Omnitrophica bacterium]|nr:30S ribosomal protein S18 [Candidatus Omnitrophota bacterium]